MNGATSREGLYSEVHTIAYFYHWAERDILKLDVGKRRKYLRLIQKQVKAESGSEDLEDELDE